MYAYAHPPRMGVSPDPMAVDSDDMGRSPSPAPKYLQHHHQQQHHTPAPVRQPPLQFAHHLGTHSVPQTPQQPYHHLQAHGRSQVAPGTPMVQSGSLKGYHQQQQSQQQHAHLHHQQEVYTPQSDASYSHPPPQQSPYTPPQPQPQPQQVSYPPPPPPHATYPPPQQQQQQQQASYPPQPEATYSPHEQISYAPPPPQVPYAPQQQQPQQQQQASYAPPPQAAYTPSPQQPAAYPPPAQEQAHYAPLQQAQYAPQPPIQHQPQQPQQQQPLPHQMGYPAPQQPQQPQQHQVPQAYPMTPQVQPQPQPQAQAQAQYQPQPQPPQAQAQPAYQQTYPAVPQSTVQQLVQQQQIHQQKLHQHHMQQQQEYFKQQKQLLLQSSPAPDRGGKRGKSAKPKDLPPLDERTQLVFLAKWAESGERFFDIVTFMSELIVKHAGPGFVLAPVERELFATGLKNVTGQKRDAWRALSGITRDDKREAQLLLEYKQQVQVELQTISHQTIGLLTRLLQYHEAEDENYVYYMKMIADYYRYLAEIFPGQGNERKSLDHYVRASKVAEAQLPTAHPLRLGLALNMSVLLYEILHDRKNAYATAKAAFDSAIPLLDRLNRQTYKDCTLILQLLRDNITRWLADSKNPLR